MNVSINIQLDDDDPILTSESVADKIFEAFELNPNLDTVSVTVTPKPDTHYLAPPLAVPPPVP